MSITMLPRKGSVGNILLIVLAIAIVLSGIYFISQSYAPSASTPAQSTQNSPQAVVSSSSGLSVLSPKTGDQLIIGLTYPVQWRGGNGNKVKISFEPNLYGNSEVVIADGIADTGSYAWMISSDSFARYLSKDGQISGFVRVEQDNINPNLGGNTAESGEVTVSRQ